MGGIRDRRKRQQEAIDSGEPLRTKKGRKKKGEKKGFRPNSLRHIGEKTGKAIINPAPTLARGARRMFGAGDRDAKTTERVVGYAFDGLTLGVAPVARLISDEARSREGQKRKKKKKHKHKHKK
jgi:hypothetical protein|tara:strand:- start:3778 stop:4149 length:372 start_codon:yes stop_codon:yes gene_type:complete